MLYPLNSSTQIVWQKEKRVQRAYVPTTALAKSVEFDDDMMHVYLTDGRIISVPLIEKR